MYSGGSYYVFRASVETHARLIMPEENDPRRRDKPDPVVAAERILGHLLDNPFNEEVRTTLTGLLRILKERYEIDYIEIDDSIRKLHPWRSFDVSKIPRKFPIIPDVRFIESLYGVSIPTTLTIKWPKEISIIHLDYDRRASDVGAYEVASAFANDVAIRVTNLTGKRAKVLARKLSPYSQPVRCYGFHAARLEFAIKFFDLNFKTVMDLGSHPGACAASFLKYSDDVTCISLKPVEDKHFCPYVIRDGRVKFIEADVNSYDTDVVYDFIHDDVDIVGSRSIEEDIKLAEEATRRANKFFKSCSMYLYTVKEIDWRVRELIYQTYVKYGSVDMVKPLFSNPWKSEFMVVFKKDNKPRMRKHVFERSFNAFLNAMAGQIIQWNELVSSSVSDFQGIRMIGDNPLQSAKFEDEWIKPWTRVDDA
jgi:hypothetical protein